MTSDERGKALSWLDGWLDVGAPVCVLQGFSGIGKSRVAQSLQARFAGPSAYVTVPAGGILLDELLLEIAEQLELSGSHTMAARPDMNLRVGLAQAMRSGCLVVIDDFQEFMDTDTRLPDPDTLKLLSQLSAHGASNGRLLVLTNASIPDGSWRDAIEVRTLPPPGEGEATALLTKLLEAEARTDAIPFARRGDVVRWLGGNPRALQVLVGCLAEDSLEDLIQLDPQVWELRDEVASRQLVAHLEARFLERTMARLDSASSLLIRRLAVYRRPFSKDALTRAESSSTETWRPLTARFLLELHRNWYSLNPIARQLALSQVSANKRELHVAYDAAADHYTRHFTARQVQDPLSHAREFVEARYHLVRAGRGEEFEAIAARFRRELLRAYSALVKVPADRDRAEELIHVLAACLDPEQSGHATIRYLLARLLVARGRQGDDVVALGQTRIAVRETSDPALWLLHLRLLAHVEGLAPMRLAAKQAHAQLSPASRADIFFLEARLLSLAGQLSEAANVVRAAIQECPTDFRVYQLACSVLLRAGNYDEWMGIAIQALAVVPPEANYHRVMEAALFPALARRDVEAIRRIAASLPNVRYADSWAALCRLLESYCLDEYDKVQDFLGTLPVDCLHYAALRYQASFGLLVAGRPEEAERLHRSVSGAGNAAVDWLIAVNALMLGKRESAEAALARCLGRALTEAEILDPNLWLRVWDDVPTAIQIYPAFYFPRLPATLTGLHVDLVRLEGSESALSDEIVSNIRLDMGTLRDAELTDSKEMPLEGRSDRTILIVNQISPVIGAIGVQGEGSVMTGDTYNVGQAGAVGPGAVSNDASFSQSPTTQADRAQLLAELEVLRAFLALETRSKEDHEAAAAIAAAHAAIEAGETSQAAGHLRRGGRWALAAATSIGTGVAAGALKAALGL